MDPLVYSRVLPYTRTSAPGCLIADTTASYIEKGYRQSSISVPLPSMKSVTNQVVWMPPPVTRIFIPVA